MVDSAHSAFRPRAVVIERISAVVSSMIFLLNVSGTSSPVLVTGDAAPMFVPGAISATWPASVMKVPALAAWAPGGETHTIVGNGASRRLITMRRVWSSAPPGVFSVMTTASAPSRCAFAIPSSR